MILDATNRTLEIILGSAITTNQLRVVSSWTDMTSVATTSGSTVSLTNGATAVTIVAAPAASTQRNVYGVSIYNADTVTQTVTVRYNDNTTLYNVVQIQVPSGYTLEYTDVQGWKLLSSTGMLQTGVGTQPFSVQGINDQTGTTYTLVLTDMNKDVRCTNASAITLTVPPNSSVAFPLGTVVLFSQGGAGIVTATAGAGVTLLLPAGAATSAQYDARGLEKTDTDTWRVW